MRHLVLAVVFTALFPLAAAAGPPAVCVPIEVDGAFAPAAGDGPWGTQAGLERDVVVRRTFVHLSGSSDPLAHMETLRHAVIALHDDPQGVRNLLSMVDRQWGPLDDFDRGYVRGLLAIFGHRGEDGAPYLDAFAVDHPEHAAEVALAKALLDPEASDLAAVRAVAGGDARILKTLDAVEHRY